MSNKLQEKKNKDSVPKEQKEKTAGVIPKGFRGPLTVPEIPGHMKKLLNDKDRPVKGLKSVLVNFYPNNSLEIQYIVASEDGTKELAYSVSEFQRLQDAQTRANRLKHEQDSISGLGAKYFKRLFVVFPTPLTLEEGRRILSIRVPPLAKRVLDLTQKEFAEQFKNQEAILEYWLNHPGTKDAMTQFQVECFEEADWPETLKEVFTDITDRKKAKETRDREKIQNGLEKIAVKPEPVKVNPAFKKDDPNKSSEFEQMKRDLARAKAEIESLRKEEDQSQEYTGEPEEKESEGPPKEELPAVPDGDDNPEEHKKKVQWGDEPSESGPPHEKVNRSLLERFLGSKKTKKAAAEDELPEEVISALAAIL